METESWGCHVCYFPSSTLPVGHEVCNSIDFKIVCSCAVTSLSRYDCTSGSVDAGWEVKVFSLCFIDLKKNLSGGTGSRWARATLWECNEGWLTPSSIRTGGGCKTTSRVFLGSSQVAAVTGVNLRRATVNVPLHCTRHLCCLVLASWYGEAFTCSGTLLDSWVSQHRWATSELSTEACSIGRHGRSDSVGGTSSAKAASSPSSTVDSSSSSSIPSTSCPASSTGLRPSSPSSISAACSPPPLLSIPIHFHPR